MAPDPVSPIPPPAANPSPVDADLAADKAGEPRPPDAPLPPPGTETPGFFQRGETHGSIVATVFYGFVFIDAWIEGKPPDPSVVILGYKAVVVAWLAAFGLYKVNKSPLIWK